MNINSHPLFDSLAQTMKDIRHADSKANLSVARGDIGFVSILESSGDPGHAVFEISQQIKEVVDDFFKEKPDRDITPDEINKLEDIETGLSTLLGRVTSQKQEKADLLPSLSAVQRLIPQGNEKSPEENISDSIQEIQQHLRHRELLLEKERILEEAKRELEDSVYNIYNMIEKYNFTDPNDRFELAKFSIMQDSIAFSAVVKEFGIENQDHLVELAKMVARQNGVTISKSIKKYGIKEESRRFEIAQIVAEQRGNEIANYLLNYNIQDPDLLFSLFKTAIVNRGSWVSFNLPNFRIQNPIQLWEAAQLEAQYTGFAVFNYINRYGFQDPELIFKLAQIAASGSTNLFVNLSEIGIENRDHLLALAKISAKAHPVWFAQNFSKFNLDAADLHEVASIALKQAILLPSNELGKSVNEIAAYFPRSVADSFPFLDLFSERVLTPEEIQKYAEISPLSKTLQPIIDQIASEDSFIRKSLTQCLGAFLTFCWFQKISEENVVKGMPMIRELFQLENPALRMNLLPLVADILASDSLLEEYDALFQLTKGRGKSYTSLLCALFAPFIPASQQAEVAQVLRDRYFQNTANRKPLLRCLETIRKAENLFPAEKEKIFRLLFSALSTPESLLSNARVISNLVIWGEFESLKQANPEDGLDPLINIVFSKAFNLHDIQNSGEKFNSTFASFRQPDAILRYAASIDRLIPENRDPHRPFLRKFILEVLEGNFKENRYAIHDSLHLQTVFNGASGKRLAEQWQAGATYRWNQCSPEEILRRKQGVSSDPIAFFTSKILMEKALPEEGFEELMTVLRAPERAKEIKVRLKMVQVKGEGGAALDNTTKKMRSFQLKVIELMYPGIPLSKEDYEMKLKGVLLCLEKLPTKYSSLSDDLKEVIASFAPAKQLNRAGPYANLQIVDTDDPCDLLLIGTEVAGSCLHVETGFANRCLLAYILDGKNRAMIVRNNEGRIVARAMLHLLWDKVEQRPILFQERTYPSAIEMKISNALDEACKLRAKELGLPLLSLKVTGVPYSHPLHSLSVKAPSEHMDAGNKGEAGSWTIEGTFLQNSAE